jgi:hypothetical protein
LLSCKAKGFEELPVPVLHHAGGREKAFMPALQGSFPESALLSL